MAKKKHLAESLAYHAIYTTTKDGIIDSWNTSAHKVFGYTYKEILGRNFFVLFTQEDIFNQSPEKELKKALEKGRFSNKRLLVRKDGTLFLGENTVSPLIDKRNTHFGYVTITQELRASSLQERERFKKDQEYAESIVQTAHEPMLVLNKDLKITTANKPFYKLFKTKKKELYERVVYSLFDYQLDDEKLKEILSRMRVENLSANYEIDVELPSIGQRTLLLNIRKLNRKHQSDMFLLALEDVTPKRTAEQNKDDFISVASHELKTPVTHIKGLVQILKRQTKNLDNPSFSKSLQLLSDQTDRFSRLVNDLLDVSRIKSGKLSLRKQEINLNSLVYESVEALKAITQSHELTIKGEITQTVSADLFKISQVLTNLLSNAIKYSPEGKRIIITLTENKDFAIVEVKDFGIGIPPEEQDKLFKRFFRTSAVQEQNFPGIGLGLHISAEIIRQHGGNIWVKSEEGKGSSFYFSLPVKGSTLTGVNE